MKNHILDAYSELNEYFEGKASEMDYALFENDNGQRTTKKDYKESMLFEIDKAMNELQAMRDKVEPKRKGVKK